ncbi:unnamed protein product [Caenorhabditis bovis]|uniref:pyrroline-5-carboxylate reductase n=1 Tax=Caenorhabditis bovis TaxID=2654633 RepID=A0A8S1F6W5_9PELO|nr:unnamed protein product [Caenorhabditis bovis]
MEITKDQQQLDRMDSGESTPELESLPIVFVGGGNMASAIIRGCLKNQFIPAEQIVIGVKSKKSEEKWRSKGFENVFTNTQQMLENYPTAIYVMCVKPQLFDEVVSSWPVNARPRIFISIMASITLGQIREKIPFLSQYTTMVRLMPNMASSIGCSATSMCYEDYGIDEQNVHIEYSKRFAECIGSVELIPERCFNAATAVAASSPAWVFMFIEALADGAVHQGLGRLEAKRMAANAVMGAAKMLTTLESGFDIEREHVGLLKDQVCSPSGTTIEGVRSLERHGFRSAVMEAVIEASSRAETMSKPK